MNVPDKLGLALQAASERVERIPEQIVLLGMEPEEADAELGYILPGAVDPNGGWTVARFIHLSLALQYRRLGPPRQVTRYGHI